MASTAPRGMSGTSEELAGIPVIAAAEKVGSAAGAGLLSRFRAKNVAGLG